jgi:hypothetical protein
MQKLCTVTICGVLFRKKWSLFSVSVLV